MKINNSKNVGELLQEHEDKIDILMKRTKPPCKFTKGVVCVTSILINLATLRQLIKK